MLDVSKNRSIESIDAHDDNDNNKKVRTHPHLFLLSSSNPAKHLQVAASTINILLSHGNSLEEINNVVEHLERELRADMIATEYQHLCRSSDVWPAYQKGTSNKNFSCTATTSLKENWIFLYYPCWSRKEHPLAA